VKVGDLVKVKTVAEQPLGIITKIERCDDDRNGAMKYYVLLNQYDFVDKHSRPWGPFPFLSPQLEVLSKSV
jgi:hypothetical protein